MKLPKPNKELLNIQLASILSESPYSDRKLCLFFIHNFDFNGNNFRITEELCSTNNPKTNKPFYDSLNGAPIVAALKGDDLGGHEPEFDEDGNIIRLNTEGIGTLFNTHIGTHQINNEDVYGLWAEGFLWLRFQNTLNVIEELYNENGRIDTSCEVSLGGFEFSENGRTAIKSVLYFGHCLLGSTKRGAYADSAMYEYNLQVAEAYQKDLEVSADNGTSDKISIDNSSDSATDGDWSEVDKSALRKSIMNASNYKSLVKETYLIVLDGYEDSPSSNLKYPHHVIKDDTLVVHKRGVQAAYSRLMQNDPDNSKALKHIKKHYNELDLEISSLNINNEGGKDVPDKQQIEFNFGKEIKNYIENNALSFDDIREQLWSQLNNEKDADGYVIYKYWIAELFNEYVVACENESGKYFKFTYTAGESDVTVDMSSAVEVVSAWIPVNQNEGTETNTVNEDLQNEVNGLKETITTKDTEINDLKTQLETLQGEISQKDEALKFSSNEANEKIIQLGKVVTDLQEQVKSFEPIKEEYNKIQNELKEKELNEKREHLKKFALDSKFISEKDIEENEEIKVAINEVDEIKINTIIAKKVVEKATTELNETKTKTDDVTIHINENGKDLIPQSLKEKMYTPHSK